MSILFVGIALVLGLWLAGDFIKRCCLDEADDEETDDNEMTFDEQTYIRDAREKANATLPESTITRAEAKNAFYELREQAADVPEMSLDEINAEISAVRAKRRR